MVAFLMSFCTSLGLNCVFFILCNKIIDINKSNFIFLTLKKINVLFQALNIPFG